MEELSTELTMLVASAMWCIALTGPLMVGRSMTPGGIGWGLGNREEPFNGPAWIGRAQRAHMNMVENLAPFAVLVLILHVLGRTSDLTALCTVVFLGARVAHSAFYIAGLVPWRTVAHTVSVGATVTLAVSLFL